MLIAFLVGLFLLNVVFGIKLLELKRGSKIILAKAREQADEWLTITWSKVRERGERELVRFREIWLSTHWSVRKRVAENLRQFARHLHN